MVHRSIVAIWKRKTFWTMSCDAAYHISLPFLVFSYFTTLLDKMQYKRNAYNRYICIYNSIAEVIV